MVDMIANKRMRYANRRLLPEDAFSANRVNARALNAIGKARYATRDMVADDEPKFADVTVTANRIVDVASGVVVSEIPAPETDERPALRAEYEAKFGKRPFPGWSAETLREKLAAG